MLRMRREDLATAAQVAQATLTDFEAGKRNPYPRTLSAIRAALEAAGIEFLNGDGPGVRVRSALDPMHRSRQSETDGPFELADSIPKT